MKSATLKACFAYARVSTGRQAQKDLSIPDQLERMRSYCEKNGLVLLREYVEAGRTATNDKRPKFQQMITDALEGEERVGYIIVYSFSRAFRNLDDMAHYVRQLKFRRVRLISITQECDETPIGRLMMLIYGLVDELNSTENAKHVKRARQKNARLGHYNGGQTPFGYKSVDTAIPGHDGFRKVLQINEDEAELVREIFDLYEGGKYGPAIGMKKIVERLNAKCLRRETSWRIQEVQRVLSDIVYTGVYLSGGRQNYKKSDDTAPEDVEEDAAPIPVSVPIIIQPDRFARLAVVRTSRSPRKVPPIHVSPPSLLTGLCKCGVCGSSMITSTGKSGRYSYLKCSRRNSISNTHCTSPNIPREQFELLVLETVVENVLTASRVAEILADSRRNVDSLSASQSQERQALVGLKSQIERKLSNLYKLVETGASETHHARKDDSLSKRIRTWQDELEVINVKLSDLKVSVAFPQNLLDGIDLQAFTDRMRALLADPSSEDARVFLRLFVDEIRVYTDEATISGPNLGVVEAAIKSTAGSDAGVPTFMHNWRRVRDSNPR